MQEGAAGQEAQVGTRLCCPSLPTLHTALSQCKSLARDGAAQGWFGKNSMAAAQGLPMELSLLGPKEFLVNGVPPSKGNQSLPLPASVDLAELSDSVVAGAD